MVQFVPVSRKRHGAKRWRCPENHGFAAGDALVPVVSVELRRVAPRHAGGVRGTGGGLPTVYQAAFWSAREGLKVVPDLSMAQATLRRRSPTWRRARPWL